MIRSAAAYLVWPLVMAGSLLVSGLGLEAGWPPGLLAFAVSTGNFLLIVALERILPRKPGVDLLRDRQAWNDVGHGILIASLARPIGGALSAAAIGVLAGLSPSAAAAGGVWPGDWPLVAQVGLGLTVWGFLGYWTHRAFHRIEPLWWFHAVHHDARQMHVLKGNRIHLGEDVIRYLLIPAPLYALGVPADVLLWISLWNNFEGALAHANVDQRFPSFSHWVLPTLQNHYLHHAAARELHDSNFAGITPIWDVLFGTYRHPDRHPVEVVGIEQSPVPQGFLAQLAFPIRAQTGRF